MGAQIDDSSKCLSCNIKPNPNEQMSHLSLLTQLCWSKNVNEERDAPSQILIGACHPAYCVLLGLACWLEYHLSLGDNTGTDFLFGIDGVNDAKRINNRARTLVNAIINAEGFDQVMEAIEELKGLHSIRKIAATRAKKCGCTKDEIDERFRWKAKRQQDTYVSTQIPYPDAKVCAALCKDGPINYHLKEESGILCEWICHHVVPHIKRVYGPVVACVLGRALLWRIFDPTQSVVVDSATVARVKNLYSCVEGRYIYVVCRWSLLMLLWCLLYHFYSLFSISFFLQ